jgi:hypothetical protein
MNVTGIVRSFTSESKLIEWLEDRNWDCGSSEAFSEWLNDFFENGNEIEVCGESYSYLDCIELI